MKKIQVAVLKGGVSTEREVSLRSGIAVAEALVQSGFEVTEIDVRMPELPSLVEIDIVFNALHGSFGEDGGVQKLLDQLNIPYTGSGALASALAFDKSTSKKTFLKKEIATPAHVLLERADVNQSCISHLRYPLVLKPVRQGSSIGIEIVREASQFDEACTRVFRFDQLVIAEEFIKGREFTVGVLGRNTLPVVEICSNDKFFTYNAKYVSPQTEYIVPAQISEELAQQAKQIAWRAHQSLGCRDLSRVDLMLDAQDMFWVLEVNTNPGFTETSLVPKAARAAGIPFNALCKQVVEFALSRKQKIEALNDSRIPLSKGNLETVSNNQ